MSLSTTHAQNILKAVYQATSYSVSTLYMSLHTADPGSTGASEVTDAAYVRVNVTGLFATLSGTSVSNSAQLLFQFMTTGFTATHFGFWDALAGTWIDGFALGSSLVVPAGDRPYFNTGDLTISAS